VFTLDLLCGFRVNRATELIGLDYMEHGFEDGSFAHGGEKATIRESTPSVDTVVERIKRVCSPQKTYTQQQRSQDDSSTTDSQNILPQAQSSDSVSTEELHKEMIALRGEVSMMRHLIRRRMTDQPGTVLKDVSLDEKRSAFSDLLQEHALQHPISFSRSLACDEDMDQPPAPPIQGSSSAASSSCRVQL